jgi:tryptophan-rich sensory protein
MKKRIDWRVLILSLILVYAIAFLGGLFTSPVTSSEWYDSIRPSITPPNWVFPIVWNILFFLIAISLYLAWISAKENQKQIVATVFGINLALNLLWSIFFFGLQRPSLAFAELLVLEASIIIMMIKINPINKTSAYLLIPYLLWVAFAGILNAVIVF